MDDCRESPAEPLLSILNDNGVEVRFHDPYVHTWQCQREELSDLDEWADLLVLITDHQEYSSTSLTTDLLNTRA